MRAANGTYATKPSLSATTRTRCLRSHVAVSHIRHALDGAVRRGRLVLSPDVRRHEREGVDLPVRMGQRDADLLAAVLEDEDVLDVRPRRQLRVAVRPDIDEQPSLALRHRCQRAGVVGGVDDDLADAGGGARRSAQPPSAASGASGRKLGHRFSKTAISKSGAGISVANESADAVGQSGQYASGGRNVRSWRPVETIVQSPSMAFHRSSIPAVAASSPRGSCAMSNSVGRRSVERVEQQVTSVGAVEADLLHARSLSGVRSIAA